MLVILKAALYVNKEGDNNAPMRDLSFFQDVLKWLAKQPKLKSHKNEKIDIQRVCF